MDEENNFLSNETSSDFNSSWSKYQLMVLQQLEDHTDLLQSLNNSIAEHKQAAAVHLAEFAMWKAQVNSTVKKTQKAIDESLQENKEMSQRVTALEQQMKIIEQLELKSKTDWSNRNTAIVTITVVLNIIIQLFVHFVKK